MTPPILDRTIQPPEIAERLGLARITIYRMLGDGTIPAIRTPGGGKWIISRARYEKWEASFGQDAVA